VSAPSDPTLERKTALSRLELELGELHGPDALGVLPVAPTPTLGRALSRKRIASAITRSGRQRRAEERAPEIQAILRHEPLVAPPRQRGGNVHPGGDRGASCF
jgi:hypothetical protein